MEASRPRVWSHARLGESVLACPITMLDAIGFDQVGQSLVVPSLIGAPSAAPAAQAGRSSAHYRTTSRNESRSTSRVAPIHVVPVFRAVTVAARIPTGETL